MESIAEYLEKLNAEQALSVTTTEGHIRVLAGAGSGKTRALTSRYCYLVDVLGISPKNILCVTFTNRAAGEMKRRVRHALGDQDLGFICTFHAFCTILLHEDINRINFPKEFVIIDKEDWREIMLRIFSDMHITLKETTVQRKIDQVLEAKKTNADTYIEYIYKLNNEELKERFSSGNLDQDDEIFMRFIYEQKKCFGVDFNDLINFATYILENFEDVRAKWQERMQYVMVDEFQDVSAKQYRIAQILSAKHKNLYIVGDSDQTIYSWRGSHVRLILDFDKKYPDAKTILLNKNYRSKSAIIRASNSLIEKNSVRYPKAMECVREEGMKPLYFHAADEIEESAWIADTIKDLVENQGYNHKDIAILYRAHYQSRSLEETFIKKNIPYRILAGTEFYGRREIKDIVCYLRMLTSADDVAFYRTINMPSRKIGKTKIAAIKECADKNNVSAFDALKKLLAEDNKLFKGTGAQSYVDAITECAAMAKDLHDSKNPDSAVILHTVPKLGDILQAVLDKSGYESFLRLEADQDRLDNMAEFKRYINEEGLDDDTTLELFLNHVALFTDLDREDEKDNVKMLTIHASKGMEFQVVFLCGLNEGIFPSRRVNTPEDMEEERRIAYVAMTRAMDRLYLSDAEGKANDGLYRYPSRFIFDAGLENMTIVNSLDSSLLDQAKKIITADEKRLKHMAELFKAGDVVVHPTFGDGTIIKVNMESYSYLIKFTSLDTERSIQFTARLTKKD